MQEPTENDVIRGGIKVSIKRMRSNTEIAGQRLREEGSEGYADLIGHIKHLQDTATCEAHHDVARLALIGWDFVQLAQFGVEAKEVESEVIAEERAFAEEKRRKEAEGGGDG